MSDKKYFEKPKRVALFRDLQCDLSICFEIFGKDEDRSPVAGYVRISEIQEVTFAPLSPEAVVGAELMTLTKMRAQVVGEFSERLAVIDGRMANLRALSGPDQS